MVLVLWLGKALRLLWRIGGARGRGHGAADAWVTTDVGTCVLILALVALPLLL